MTDDERPLTPEEKRDLFAEWLHDYTAAAVRDGRASPGSPVAGRGQEQPPPARDGGPER
jgi:hypothetical protein